MVSSTAASGDKIVTPPIEIEVPFKVTTGQAEVPRDEVSPAEKPVKANYVLADDYYRRERMPDTPGGKEMMAHDDHAKPEKKEANMDGFWKFMAGLAAVIAVIWILFGNHNLWRSTSDDRRSAYTTPSWLTQQDRSTQRDFRGSGSRFVGTERVHRGTQNVWRCTYTVNRRTGEREVIAGSC